MATLARRWRSDKRARTTERKVTGPSAATTGPKLLTRLPPDIGQHVAAYLGGGDVNPRQLTRPTTAAASAEDSDLRGAVAAVGRDGVCVIKKILSVAVEQLVALARGERPATPRKHFSHPKLLRGIEKS